MVRSEIFKIVFPYPKTEEEKTYFPLYKKQIERELKEVNAKTAVIHVFSHETKSIDVLRV